MPPDLMPLFAHTSLVLDPLKRLLLPHFFLFSNVTSNLVLVDFCGTEFFRYRVPEENIWRKRVKV